MAIYLKKFETQAAYEAAQSGLILPNVSLTVDNNTVYYNPVPPTPTETRVVAKYYVTDTTSPTQLFFAPSGSGSGSGDELPFSAMEIDGVEQSEVVNEYTFNTTGEHTVKYTLIDPTSIGNSAFYGCSGLTSINIPSGVTSIGGYAFYGCSGLTSIDIPDSVTNLGTSAFVNCTSLTSATIGSGVTSIGGSVFESCTSLTSINIPSGVTSIGDSVFRDCSGLTSIVIPDSVTSIGELAFIGCSNLTSITVDVNNINYSSEDGVLFNKAKTTLIQYPVGNTRTSYNIPDSVTSIGVGAFYGCSGLTSIVIPDSVTSIGSSAFKYCSGLTSCTIGSGVTSIGGAAFQGCSGLTSCTIGSGVTSIGGVAFQGCYSLTNVIIPSSVTSISNSAFYGCSGLTSIVSNATTAPTITSDTFRDIKTGGTLSVPSGSSGYNVWMGTGNYYLGKYNWTKVEQ